MIENNLFDLSGKHAVVVGGAGEIGKVIAEGLAAFGADIAIVDQHRQKIMHCVKELQETYQCTAAGYEADITRKAQVELAVQYILEKFDHIDILVNSAGINFREPVISITEDHFDRILQVNLKGILLCCQAVGKHMMKRRYGKIVNIASVSSTLAHTERGSYAASKGGAVQLTKVMAHEWAKYGITVNAVSPGAVMTSFITEMVKSDQQRLKLEQKVPAGRIADPQDIVGPVVFLASEAADYVTGVNLFVDGGRTLD